MGKYGSCLSVRETFNLEREEMEKILERYNILEEERKALTGMLEQAYFQLNKAYAYERALETVAKKQGVDIDKQVHELIIEISREEEKYPWVDSD